MRTRDVVHVGMYVALFTALEVLSNYIPFKMPQGGSVSLGAVALVMASYHLGLKKSIITTVVAFFIMMILPGNQIYFLNVIQFLCDYLFAYGAYAFACTIKDVKLNTISLPIGILITSFVRFMFHNIAGWSFFSEYYPGNVLFGVMVYNAYYMVPTTILTFVVVVLIKPRLIGNFSR